MASPRAVSLARVAFSSSPRYLRTERQGPPDSPLPATNGRQPDEPRRPAPARPPVLSAYRHSGLSRPVRTGQRQSCCFFQICNASCRSRAPRSWSFSFLATIPISARSWLLLLTGQRNGSRRALFRPEPFLPPREAEGPMREMRSVVSAFFAFFVFLLIYGMTVPGHALSMMPIGTFNLR